MRRPSSFVCLSGLIVLAGCMQTTPVLDTQFGRSLSMIKAQQIIDPQAGRDADPVVGIDGKAAKSAYDQYQKSYRATERQPNVFTIGVGSGR